MNTKGRFPRLVRRDGAILAMLGREAINALRSIRRGDMAWIIFGGIPLAAYGIAIAVRELGTHGEMLRSRPGLVAAALSVAALLFGFSAGLGAKRAALKRILAPWMAALPLSVQDRRRMVALALLAFGAMGLLAGCGAAYAALRLIDAAGAPLGASCFTVLFASSFGLQVGRAMREVGRGSAAMSTPTGPRRRAAAVSLRRADRWSPAWLGSWAWRLDAGRIGLGFGLAFKVLGFGVIAALAIGASMHRREALPATLAGTFGGLAVFMSSLRCRPLGSSVLRSAPASFTRIWLRLIGLPLALSAAYFAILAGTALASEPSAWSVPAQGAVELAILGAIYAVFAAYFLTRPGLAGLAFLTAVAYANYEALEYGDPVYAALAILVGWLWLRARRRFMRG